MQQSRIPSSAAEPVLERIPEARYAYYRRCQIFRKGGEQCKAPAEKGSHICYAHAGQQAMAFRRELEWRVVLAEAVAEMRRQGHTECELDNLLMDFKGIQVTIAVMARALIAGRVDCKTAGRLVVHLQRMSKLLWLYHRRHRGTQREKSLTTKDTKEHEESKSLPRNTDNADLQDVAKNNSAANERGKARIVSVSLWFSAETAEFRTQARRYWISSATIARVDDDTGVPISLEQQGYRDRGQAHGPPELRA